MEALWLAVQDRIEQRIGSQNFEIWVKPIRYLDMVDDTVELAVPNRYYSDWVRDNYQGIFQEELAEVIGRPVGVRFQEDEDGEESLPPSSHTEQLTEEPIGVNAAKSRNITPTFTFDNYVVGACNEFAHAAAQAVADHPGTSYNPLFVFGSTGLGKTHLIQAIGNEIVGRDRTARIVYTTAEDFVNEMIRALRFKKMDEFRQRYRQNADLLLIDDIQFLSGKDRSQAEFFHTFESLKNGGRQIILTADVLPREIDKLEPRLRTRFEGGLLADIQPPDIETMVAILHRKAELLGMAVPDDLALWISSRVRGNIRELEGALNRLAALNRFYSEPLTIDFARRHLGTMLADEPEALTPDKIMQVVARFFNIKVSDLKGKRKLKGIVRPRQIAMYLARQHTELSFPDLGRAFGGRDHSTVQHACKKIGGLMGKDPDLRNHVETLARNLGV